MPTEHFLLKTTLAPEKARELATALEANYRIWEEIYEGLMPAWGRTEPPVVWIFNTNADFMACVASEAPDAAHFDKEMPTSRGFALTDTAFFREEELQKVEGSLSLLGIAHHECSHLIHAGIRKTPLGSYRGLWCVEGMATLMEPLQTAKSQDWNGLAQSRTPRFLATAMASLDELPVLFDKEVSALHGTHYGHAYILSHFLMYAQGGAHRRDLLACLLACRGGEYRGYDAHFHQMPKMDLCALAKSYAKIFKWALPSP